MPNVDYKKLLERCMYRWVEAEGCCWDGHGDDGTDVNGDKIFDELSNDEQNGLNEIQKSCWEKYGAANAKNELLRSEEEERIEKMSSKYIGTKE